MRMIYVRFLGLNNNKNNIINIINNNNISNNSKSQLLKTGFVLQGDSWKLTFFMLLLLNI